MIEEAATGAGGDRRRAHGWWVPLPYVLPAHSLLLRPPAALCPLPSLPLHLHAPYSILYSTLLYFSFFLFRLFFPFLFFLVLLPEFG